MAKSAFNDLLNSNKLVLVDFHAEWCGPCKALKPILEQLKSSMGEAVKIVKIDVDKNNSIASTLQVQGVPTLILFKEGKKVWRQSGVLQATELEKIINNYA
jgi:thioredoxin 1